MSQKNESSSSGFILGLIFGAIIGAAVAIYFYKNPKNEVVASLRRKFEEFFGAPLKKSAQAKKSVILPPYLTIPTPLPVPKLKAKKFLTPKR